MDTTWADELCERKVKRDGVLPEGYKQQLIDGVMAYADGPPHRSGSMSDQDKADNIQRLIGLRRRDDEREQTEWEWAQKGYEVTADYHQAGKISNVKLKFTPEEWADLLNKEGEYLGVCCANISRVRDILMDAIREDGEVRATDLEEAAELIKGHGCEHYEEDHPLSRLVALYETLKDHLHEGHHLFHNSFNPDDPDEALKAFATYASAYSDYSFQMRMGGDDADPARKFHDCVNREKALIDIASVLHTLVTKLRSLSIGLFGYGLIDEEGKVAYSRSGLAVYKDEAFAKELCERWNREEEGSERRKRGRKKYTVRPVYVSMDRGVEIR
jgi:hypothetical protein